MATFQEVQDRITNEYLGRGTFIEETKTAIRAAVRNYENRRWVFNETSVALATSAGVSFVAFPNNFLLIDKLQITVDSTELELFRRDRAWILAANATRLTNQPTDYATYQNRINLSAIPNAAYALPIYFIKKLPILSAQDDTNGFLEGVWQDVICYHAAKVVWGVALRNDTEAAKFASLERIAMMNVTEHFEQTTANKIKPTQF